MFDVSLVELAVIGLVALLVLGPERLPRAARMAGLYLRKARAAWYSVRSQFEQELATEDLRRIRDEAGKSLKQVRAEVSGERESEAADETQADRAASDPEASPSSENPDTPDADTLAADADALSPQDWRPEEDIYVPSEPPFGGQDQAFEHDRPVPVAEDVPATATETAPRQD